MPTYVYECSACGKVFEADQRMSESPLETCILCHKTGTIKRVIQPVGIAFKGSGFHINDYSASKPPSEASAPAETKTESSPAEPATPAVAPTPTETAAPATPAKTESSN